MVCVCSSTRPRRTDGACAERPCDPSPAEASTPTTRPSGTPAASRADPVHPRRDLEEREIPQELPPTPFEGSRRSTRESRQIAGGTPSEASSFPGYQDAIFSTEV